MKLNHCLLRLSLKRLLDCTQQKISINSKRILIGAIFLLIMWTICFTGQKVLKHTFTTQRYDPPEMKPSNDKLILLWNPVYRSVQDLTEYFTTNCPANKCKVTSNKKYFSSADAVLFEADSLQSIPKKTKMGQVWIYTDMESPAYRGNHLAKWNNVFNWTISYRRDSDIPFYYGSIFGNENKSNNFLSNVEDKTNRMLWMVSHCNTPSKREKYAGKLTKFIDVDVIGRCGKNICDREQTCQEKMMNKYKYYFGAENADCRDYITEKAYRTLQYPIIPILRGGYNYSVFLPQSSYIDAHQFTSAKELANYMKRLNKDKQLYHHYFTWKKDYASSEAPTKSESFCLMCQRLQNQSKFRRLYRSIHDWWRGNERNSGYFCRKNQLCCVDQKRS